jgi:hypothetical protein
MLLELAFNACTRYVYGLWRFDYNSEFSRGVLGGTLSAFVGAPDYLSSLLLLGIGDFNFITTKIQKIPETVENSSLLRKTPRGVDTHSYSCQRKSKNNQSPQKSFHSEQLETEFAIYLFFYALPQAKLYYFIKTKSEKSIFSKKQTVQIILMSESCSSTQLLFNKEKNFMLKRR